MSLFPSIGRIYSMLFKTSGTSERDAEVAVFAGTGDPSGTLVPGGQAMASTQTALNLKQDASDSSDLLWFTTDGGTTWASINEGGIQSATVSITATELRAIETTPIELVATPGAGKWLEFISAHFFLDFGTIAFDDAAADGNLDVTYTNLAGESVGGLEADGFIDAVADAHKITKNADVLEPCADIATATNKALVLSNDGAAFTGATADSVLLVRTFYRVHDLTIAV